MGLTAIILLGPDFEDREVFYPLYRLREAGFEVKTAGIGSTEYKGKYGVPIMADGQCEDFVNDSWDVVIIPGGWAPDKIRMNSAALQIVRQAHASQKIVAAICHGGWVLSSADIIRDRTVTSFLAIKDDMTHAGAYWVDQDVVIDGNLITSRKPDDLPAFCKAILSAAQKPALV